MLRPAGLIIRAEWVPLSFAYYAVFWRSSLMYRSIAQDDHRKPRGYGTALFATEADASRAVGIFNG